MVFRARLLAFWCLLLDLLTLIVPLAGPAHAGGPHALYVIDANTGAVLVDQDGSDPRFPASLTKMMTLYLTFEALEARRLGMSTRITISQQAANAAPSKLELQPGEDIALTDAIHALITKSANDIAIALAEHIGGSESNFARLMTAKAHELGMKNTTFKNASGLPDGGQTTTARDMVTLGLRLYDDFPRYFPLFATHSFTYNGATHKNHNTLMLQMPGINGIKTGYTHASGFNLVTSYQHDGKHLIGAIFGGETAGSRNATMRIALSKALARASTTRTRKPVLVARAEAKAAESKARIGAAPQAGQKSQPPAAPVKVAGHDPASVLAAPPASAGHPAATAPATPPLRIEVAKVRQVDVASAAPSTRAVAPASENVPAAFAQASASPRIGEVLKTRVVPKATPAPGSDVRKPSSFEQQMAVLAQNIGPAEPPPVAVSAGSAVPVAPADNPVADPGRPPSSPDARRAGLTAAPAQVQAAAAEMPKPNYRLNGPGPGPNREAALKPAQGYEIQIGAYAVAAEAERRLASARTAAPAVLDGHSPSRQTVTVNDKLLYRARFSGFDAAGATAACAELNRLAINCIAIKAE